MVPLNLNIAKKTYECAEQWIRENVKSYQGAIDLSSEVEVWHGHRYRTITLLYHNYKKSQLEKATFNRFPEGWKIDKDIVVVEGADSIYEKLQALVKQILHPEILK